MVGFNVVADLLRDADQQQSRARLALSSVMRDARSVLSRGPKPIMASCNVVSDLLREAGRQQSRTHLASTLLLSLVASDTRFSRED